MRIFNGKSKFPISWSNQRILNTISDIATDPSLKPVWTRGASNSLFAKSGLPSRYRIDGVRDGIKIRVVYEPATGSIITGFPLK